MMTDVIHAQKTVDGWLYRIWSTVVDDYTHEEMDEGEMVNCLLDHAKEAVLWEIQPRLERARIRGTSSFLEERSVDGPWDEWPQDFEDPDDD